MSLKVVNPNLTAILDAIISHYSGDFVIRLFQNNITPTQTTVLSDFTEADFNGYAFQNLTSFGSSTLVGSTAITVATLVNWTKAAGGTGNSIYGYYIQDFSSNLLWAERDPSAPVNMNVDGATYGVIPQLALQDI